MQEVRAPPARRRHPQRRHVVATKQTPYGWARHVWYWREQTTDRGPGRTGHANQPGKRNACSDRPGRILILAAGVLTFCALGPGCHRTTRFEITDYHGKGEPNRYFQDFEECYYDLDAMGNVDIVARHTDLLTTDPDDATTQIVRLHGIWQAVPGTTRAESTQLNTTVSYWIMGESGGVGFEGGGFIVFTEDARGNVLTGELELSALQPTRQVGNPPVPFAQAELIGRFSATRDKRRVIRVVNEMKRFFGPAPRYEPAPPGPM